MQMLQVDWLLSFCTDTIALNRASALLGLRPEDALGARQQRGVEEEGR